MKSGVYTITLSSGHFYVGATANLRKRLCNHKSTLRAGIHGNRVFQATATDSDIEDLALDVVLYSDDKEKRDALEQALITEHYSNPLCMNICMFVDASRFGLTHTAEAKAKMSKVRKGRRPPNYDRMIDGNRKRVVCSHGYLAGITFESAKAASLYFKSRPSAMTRYIRRATVVKKGELQGWTFQYQEASAQA